MASRRHRFWASGLGLAMKSHAARSSVAASAPAATPLLTDLIAYWDLDETSGTRADSHTNGLDLTDNNTVGSGLGVDGVSTAADFELDNNEYLSRASSTYFSLDGTTFHFVAWIKIESLGNRTIWGCVSPFSHQLTSNAHGDLLADAWATNAPQITIAAALSAGTWAFVEFKIDTATQKVGIAVNAGAWTENAYTTYTDQGSSPLFIGARGAANLTFDGLMQSVGFWRRILTDDERTWLYNSGSAARTYADVAAYEG